MKHLPLLLALVAACGGSSDECAMDEHCLVPNPVDGVTDLPAGRIAIAWFMFGGEYGQDTAEVAFDAPWDGEALTHIPLDAIADPSAAFIHPGVTECGTAAVAVIVLSTDPDGSGAITPDEIVKPTLVGIYGVAHAAVIHASVACDQPADTFPDGVLAGTHVYAGTERNPFPLADGVPVDLYTCAPGTAACNMLEGPF